MWIIINPMIHFAINVTLVGVEDFDLSPKFWLLSLKFYYCFLCCLKNFLHKNLLLLQFVVGVVKFLMTFFFH